MKKINESQCDELHREGQCKHLMNPETCISCEDEKVKYEEEWYSNCCDAPPLYELCIDPDTDMQLGMCMCCRDNSVFEFVNEAE